MSVSMEAAEGAVPGGAARVVQADIAIIGGGLAGLSATIEASTINPSLRIVLIDKEAKIGGNSAKASSGINAAVSAEDQPVFAEDTIKSGAGLSDEKMVDVFVKQSPEAIAFLERNGVDLSVLCQLGGHTCKRTHRNQKGPNVGFAIVSALQKQVQELSNVQVLTQTKAERFLMETNSDTAATSQLRGLLAKQNEESILIESPNVILATGGFSYSAKLLGRFAPGMESFPTTNGACATGDGILLAEDLGADLVHMDKVQLHPTGFINPKDRTAQQKFLAPEAIRGSGAVLLNVNGKRFVNELSTRDLVSQAILSQPEKMAFMFLFEGAQALESALGFYKHIGLVKLVHSVAEAAEYTRMDATALLNELNKYASIAAQEQPDPFGKQYFPYPLGPIASVDDPIEIHVMEVAPAVHYCMGGVKINSNTQVLRAGDETPIEGVFAAGEVSGGLHGANRLGGNSLAECVVFGRIAAQQAASRVIRP